MEQLEAKTIPPMPLLGCMCAVLAFEEAVLKERVINKMKTEGGGGSTLARQICTVRHSEIRCMNKIYKFQPSNQLFELNCVYH